MLKVRVWECLYRLKAINGIQTFGILSEKINIKCINSLNGINENLLGLNLFLLHIITHLNKFVKSPTRRRGFPKKM